MSPQLGSFAWLDKSIYCQDKVFWKRAPFYDSNLIRISRSQYALSLKALPDSYVFRILEFYIQKNESTIFTFFFRETRLRASLNVRGGPPGRLREGSIRTSDSQKTFHKLGFRSRNPHLHIYSHIWSFFPSPAGLVQPWHKSHILWVPCHFSFVISLD